MGLKAVFPDGFTFDFDMWVLDKTPCGKTVFCAEMSTWEGNGRPDPLTNKPCGNIELHPIFEGEELNRYVGQCPSGAYIRLWND